MRQQWIVGNWKMYGSKVSVEKLLTALKVYFADRCALGPLTPQERSVKMVVCPPYVFLDQTQALLRDTPIAWAAQNMAPEKEGAYTGEISAAMLIEFACQFVLIGHSERRSLYGETDALIAKKFALATELGITPILCLGETLVQRQAEQTQLVLQRQIKAVMDLGETVFGQGILAYEPVWAIGTGVSASPEQAQSVHHFLRQQIASRYPGLVQKLPILYGGSVKRDNAKDLFRMPDIDGGLIGGASLHASDFLKIYEDCVSL